MTTLHPTTFEFLQPTEKQIGNMRVLRIAAKVFASTVDDILPNGPDKTYALRKIREIAMWNNVALTRQPDGAPRLDAE